MGIEKMELVTLVGRIDELDRCLDKCCESGCFHIEPAFSSVGTANGLTMLNEKNGYTAQLKTFERLAADLDIDLVQVDHSDYAPRTPEEFAQRAQHIGESFEEQNRRKKEALQKISEMSGAITQINHLKGMNSDFREIFSCKYVASRIGRLPTDNLEKLDYYDENFFFIPFETQDLFCWGMYFCPEAEKAIVDDLFRSMYFERIQLPDFVEGDSDEAVKRLSQELVNQQAVVDNCQKDINVISQQAKEEILKAYSKLIYLSGIFELRKKIGFLSGKFYMKGFVPKRDKEKFSKLMQGFDSLTVTFMPPNTDANCTPPTILRNSRLTRPFRMLVEMYGLPNYDGFNPTAFVAVTYTLLFGIMFGDLGQGFLVVLLGLIVGKKINKDAGSIMKRCGLSSMLFGTLYGSVFGYEDLLDPVFEKIGVSFLPLNAFKETGFILITAVGIGVGLIILSMMINIYVGFKQKNYEKAIFGCNGIAGLVFYSSLAAGLVGTLMFDMKIMSAPFVIFLIVIPLVCIFCRVPFSIAMKYKKFRLSADEEEKMTVGGFIVENFFEMFEFLLSYISNTMSFLRVGGFVLSHAGMMLVVMTLMKMVSSTAQPFVLIIGNAFVMAMEGMIVAIQIIRLEFYEIFSRFNESDGVPFEPVGANFSAQTE